MNLIPWPSWTSLNVALSSATPLAQRWANPAHTQTHKDTQTQNYKAKQFQTALKYVTKALKAVCEAQNQRQHLFFLVTLWFFFLLKPKWIFFTSTLSLLFMSMFPGLRIQDWRYQLLWNLCADELHSHHTRQQDPPDRGQFVPLFLHSLGNTGGLFLYTSVCACVCSHCDGLAISPDCVSGNCRVRLVTKDSDKYNKILQANSWY